MFIILIKNLNIGPLDIGTGEGNFCYSFLTWLFLCLFSF